MDLHDVVQQGAVVYSDRGVDTLITVGKNELAWWQGDFSGGYAESGHRRIPFNNNNLTVARAIDLAQEWVADNLTVEEREAEGF